eukprot:2776343-Pyramimonas_sp.AAC.1
MPPPICLACGEGAGGRNLGNSTGRDVGLDGAGPPRQLGEVRGQIWLLSATKQGMATPGRGLRSAPLGPGGRDAVLVGAPQGAGGLYRGPRAPPRAPPNAFPRAPVANHTPCKPHPLQ